MIRRYVLLLGGALVLIGLVGGALLAVVRVPGNNAAYTVVVLGVAGTPFSGECTHEMAYRFAPDRTLSSPIAGTIPDNQQPQEFTVEGSRIGCLIDTARPELPLWVELRQGGERLEWAQSEPPDGRVVVGHEMVLP